MVNENKYSRGYPQLADRVKRSVPDNDNSEQQDIGHGEQDKEYNRQLRQLIMLVKKAGIKFGDFSQLDNKKRTG